MLIPDCLFYFILQNHGYPSFKPINLHSVRIKRYWKRLSDEEMEKWRAERSADARRYWDNLSEEEREEFRAMRSRVQKETFKKHPHLRKIRAKSFKKATQKYWDTVSEKKKSEHIAKMSAGMKKAWDESDDNFGPKVANRKNVVRLNGNIKIEKDVPRINDYAGVVTFSEMEELNAEA